MQQMNLAIKNLTEIIKIKTDYLEEIKKVKAEINEKIKDTKEQIKKNKSLLNTMKEAKNAKQ